MKLSLVSACMTFAALQDRVQETAARLMRVRIDANAARAGEIVMSAAVMDRALIQHEAEAGRALAEYRDAAPKFAAVLVGDPQQAPATYRGGISICNQLENALQTHHIFKEFFEGANGHRTEPVERRIHVSRMCQNCDHYRTESADDWNIEEAGHCMNLTVPYGPDMWCSDHQTEAEFEAGVHRIERPVLALVKAPE